MKISIDTNKLKDMLSKVGKGVGNNKLLPITSLIALHTVENSLHIIATDNVNYIECIEECDGDNEFYTVLDASTLIKLISKQTSTTISIEIDGNAVIVKGNGTYKLSIIKDSSGNNITFPKGNKIEDISIESTVNVDMSDLLILKDCLKSSMAVSYANPALRNYCLSTSGVITTDSIRASKYDKDILHRDIVLTPEIVNLLDNIDADEVKCAFTENTVQFETDNCIIWGEYYSESFANFPLNALLHFFKMESVNEFSVNKSDLINTLDRLSLFTDSRFKGETPIILKLGANDLTVSDVNNEAVETVEYLTINSTSEAELVINAETLIQELKSCRDNTVKILTSKDNKLVALSDDNITHVICTMVMPK